MFYQHNATCSILYLLCHKIVFEKTVEKAEWIYLVSIFVMLLIRLKPPDPDYSGATDGLAPEAIEHNES